MKKVYNVFKSIGEWLAKAGADRYLHLLAGLVIAFFTAMLMQGVAGEGRWTCVGFSMMVTVVVGILKEVADQTYEGESDALDWARHVHWRRDWLRVVDDVDPSLRVKDEE